MKILPAAALLASRCWALRWPSRRPGRQAAPSARVRLSRSRRPRPRKPGAARCRHACHEGRGEDGQRLGHRDHARDGAASASRRASQLTPFDPTGRRYRGRRDGRDPLSHRRQAADRDRDQRRGAAAVSRRTGAVCLGVAAAAVLRRGRRLAGRDRQRTSATRDARHPRAGADAARLRGARRHAR